VVGCDEVPVTTRDLIDLPDAACDTHIHIYDPAFPVAPTTLLRPPPASVADYVLFQQALGIDRVVVVQPTTYGLDNSCQLESVASFGDIARAIVVLDSTATAADVSEFTAVGARGARFHMLPGGAVDWSQLDVVARTIEPFGWHIQLQLNGRQLTERADQLHRLPTPLVIDHVGRFAPPVPVEHPAFTELLSLVDSGRCWVKVSAPYESSATGPPIYRDVEPLVRSLVSAAPERLLWASNWPHPGQAAPPDAEALLRLLAEWIPDSGVRSQILVDNPARLYGFDNEPPPRRRS